MCTATSVPLRADDLHEYEKEKRNWRRVTTNSDKPVSQGLQTGSGAGSGVQPGRREEIKSRLGLEK